MSFDPQCRSLTLAGPQGATHSSQVLPLVPLPEASRVCGSHGLTHLGPHGPEAAVPWTVGSFPFPCVLHPRLCGPSCHVHYWDRHWSKGVGGRLG